MRPRRPNKQQVPAASVKQRPLLLSLPPSPHQFTVDTFEATTNPRNGSFVVMNLIVVVAAAVAGGAAGAVWAVALSVPPSSKAASSANCLRA